jgi:hypothetical protein
MRCADSDPWGVVGVEMYAEAARRLGRHHNHFLCKIGAKAEYVFIQGHSLSRTRT